MTFCSFLRWQRIVHLDSLYLDDEEYERLLQDKDTRLLLLIYYYCGINYYRDYLLDKGQNIDYHVLLLFL